MQTHGGEIEIREIIVGPINLKQGIERFTTTQWIMSDAQPKLFRSEEHTSELQSHSDPVCRLLLEKKKKRGYWPFVNSQLPRALGILVNGGAIARSKDSTRDCIYISHQDAQKVIDNTGTE